jgi:hypothetical protein
MLSTAEERIKTKKPSFVAADLDTGSWMVRAMFRKTSGDKTTGCA